MRKQKIDKRAWALFGMWFVGSCYFTACFFIAMFYSVSLAWWFVFAALWLPLPWYQYSEEDLANTDLRRFLRALKGSN